MSKFKYFTLAELLKSDTATARHIDNTPSFEVVEHLATLTEKILDPLRAAYGKPITVTSGYRCEKLNKAVGGVNGSAHLRGDAADLRAADIKGFKNFVEKWLRAGGAKFDQCLLEKSGNTEWVHISIRSATGSQRGQIQLIQL
ncbi:MAG: peptidase M15 [Bacteroidales bacterium]|nr:peptidase M15 [Bacteroidales bacterium]